jgi:NTE family protein
VRSAFEGLALAAGGARGAYQVGALLCLAEQGLRFRQVAGSSVGALNGAFLAQGDGSPGHLSRLAELWRTLPRIPLLRPSARVVAAGAALVAGTGGAATALARALAAGRTTLLDPGPLARLLDRWLDYGRIRRSAVDLIIVALAEVMPSWDIISAPWRAARYLPARGLRPAELRAALLASAAIPLVFPARTVGDRRYADAGLVDPLPARALYQRGARSIVSVFLSDGAVQDRRDFPGAQLLQVRPSRPLGSALLSVLDFSRGAVERLIDLGYRDARAIADEVIDLADDLIALRAGGQANQALAEALPHRRARRRT